MANLPGPWDPPPPRRTPPVGLFVWIVLVTAIGLGIWQLSELLPGRAIATGDYVLVARNLVMIAAASSGLIFIRRIPIGRAARDIGIWVGLGALLVLAHAYQDELRGVGARMLSALIPGYAASSGDNELVVAAANDGHFHIIGAVNGIQIEFLIDTGASDIVLSPGDARRIGLDLRRLVYSRDYETANGVGHGASVTLASMRMGPIERLNQAASVNQAEMRNSLLGMTFFRNVASFEIRGPNLLIRWR